MIVNILDILFLALFEKLYALLQPPPPEQILLIMIEKKSLDYAIACRFAVAMFDFIVFEYNRGVYKMYMYIQ